MKFIIKFILHLSLDLVSKLLILTTVPQAPGSLLGESQYCFERYLETRSGFFSSFNISRTLNTRKNCTLKLITEMISLPD